MSSKKNHFFVDGEKHEWDRDTITGIELRSVAAIPEGAQIFQHVSGKPDVEIFNETVVNFAKHQGVLKFSTQSPGSQAG